MNYINNREIAKRINKRLEEENIKYYIPNKLAEQTIYEIILFIADKLRDAINKNYFIKTNVFYFAPDLYMIIRQWRSKQQTKEENTTPNNSI